jgi:acetylornithine deacetylase
MYPQDQNTRELLAALVSIDSVNPDLVPGGAGEARIAAFIAEWLSKAGASVKFDEPKLGRISVIARVAGTGGGRSLMLNGHIDTVGTEGMSKPHHPRIEGQKLFGRGAYDMKAGVTAAMLALADAAHLRLRGDVILTAVCDEEYGSLGTESVLKRVSADAAIVTEPTGLDIAIAHKGFAWFDIETFGVAAHGSRPDLGRDAILYMGRFLNGLDRLNRALEQGQKHFLVGAGSLHASLIQGGQELSSYPEKCRLSIERRTRPGETPEQVEMEIREILTEMSTGDPDFKASLKAGLSRKPFEVGAEESIVLAARQAVNEQLGREATLVGMSAWTDAALVSSSGIPTVILGPGGAGAHAVQEWANLDELAACQEILVKIISDFCA